MPKLSILLPTYNGARFLDEQLESIWAQDDPDFELLAIDDGSTDATRDLLAAHAAREPRMRVLPSAGNNGQNQRLLQLVNAAGGDFLAISDQDDRWAPDRNSRLFAAMKGRPMALGRSELIAGDGKPLGRSLLDMFKVMPGPRYRLRSLLRPMFSAHATIMRRDWLEPTGFSHPLPFDWLMGVEALFSGGLVYVDEAVVYHRIHGGNQVNNLRLTATDKYTKSHLRWILLHRRSTRINFWLMLNYLGKSVALDSATRAMFRALAQHSHVVWFSEWRSLRQASGLRDRIRADLRPFAGSEEDWTFFSGQIDALTALPWQKGMLRDVMRRWRED